MPDMSLQATGQLALGGAGKSVPVKLDVTLAGAPFSLRITAGEPFTLEEIWDALGDELDRLIGISLPQIPAGPWDAILEQYIQPTVWVSAKPGANGGYSAYFEFLLTDAQGTPKPFTLGVGPIDVGPVTISFEPTITVFGLYITHDSAAGGLDIRAKIETPTTTGGSTASGTAGGSPDGAAAQKMVSYPFPLPPQSSYKTFQLIYFGLGQRVGPDPVGSGAVDPMATIFQQLTTELTATDPRTVLTDLAETFYHPDRDWFVAAELGLRFWNLKVLFNDPAMYGLEITAEPTTPPSYFDGLLFEILYQKLGPNLGVYYGALDLPYTMRRIPLDGFILILPGFSVWIYTNGDFRVNVGWPVGGNSIGIQIDVLIGYAGFYFAKLRSSDNPGAQPTVDYNPILEFGLGIAVYCQESVNASIFSATMSVTLTASFQGLLAWRGDGGSLASAPDHYWFAGSAALSVLLQGSVDFAILKASVTVSFDASVSFAMETGYITVIDASADVSVEVSVHIVFFTIHLSFSAHISHSFTIGSGAEDASMSGPLAPGLQVNGPSTAIAAARGVRRQALATLEALSVRSPLRVRAPEALPARMGVLSQAAAAGVAPSATLYFMLQPTALYQASPTAAYVATLVADCPPPGGSPLGSPGEATNFELLVVVLVQWMLEAPFPASPPPLKLSALLADLCTALGAGAEPPGAAFGGSIAGFGAAVLAVLQSQMGFEVIGVDNANPPDFQVAAALPMFPDLVMDAGGGEVDFNLYNPAPADYEQAINIYFADLGLIGPGPDTGSPPAPAPAASASPGPSLATLLFGDYFLLLCRFVAASLRDDALAYEKQQDEAYLAAAETGRVGAAEAAAVAVHEAALDPTEELAQLLDAFDYAGAAGAGSRFLLQGLQLPEPALTPLDPTPQSMAAVPTGGLYSLTGQQFSDPGGSPGIVATLAAGPTAPAGWLSFSGGSAATATAAGGPAPPEPAVSWVAAAERAAAAGGDAVTVRPLPPLTQGALRVSLNSQIAWTGPGLDRAIFPLPPAVTARLAPAGLRLDLDAGPAGHSPSAVPATAALLIRLTASQVQQASTSDVSPGSPGGSPGAGPGYVPFVYQLTGADEATRELIYQALQGGLAGASIDVLYTPPGAAGAQSDAVSHLMLVRNNLSTESQAAQVSAAAAERLRSLATGSPDNNSASATDVPAFLRLIWELSVVNAPGYYLYYRTEDGQGLPADLFADSAPTHGSPSTAPRAAVAGTIGGAAQLDILVQFSADASPSPAIPAFGNAMFVDSLAAGAVVSAAVLDTDGVPVPAFAPTYPAGSLGFEIDWTPAASPDIDQLYHLIQYAVQTEGVYAGSAWSLPIGPEGHSAWAYRQVLPLTAFLATGSPQPNRYEVINQPVTLGFRLSEIYGNTLPQGLSTPFTALYNDPLLAPPAWPGVHVSYYFDELSPASPARGPALFIDLAFDPDGLVLAASPSRPSGGDRAVAQWRAIAAQYALIADQLADPNTAWAVVTSLIGEDVAAADPRASLQAFVGAVQEIVAARIDPNAPPPPGSPDQPYPATIAVPIALAQVAAQPHDVVAIDVAFTVSRPADLIDPATLQALPAIGRVVAPLAAQLAPAAGASAGGPSSASAFAQRFERAFAGFDGHGGGLKVAQRATTSADPAAVASLWAVRFSASAGFDIGFDGTIATFALRPLNTVPITRADPFGVLHSDVDLDAWAAQFLQAMDAFLSPQFCAAIAVLDPASLDALMGIKTTLAEVIPFGLAAVLQDDLGAGDLDAARETLQQALLQTLSTAYSLSALVQCPATVQVTGVADDASPGLGPPQLFGALGAPTHSPQPGPRGAALGSPPAGAQVYALSSAPLTLAQGTQWLTSLLTVAQPTAMANVELPLEFAVSYMQHDIDVTEAWQGFTPSSWIKFALPGDATLLLPVTPQAVIPVPLGLKPPIPVLKSQTAVAAPIGSPSTLEQEIAQALTWDYTVQLSAGLAAQDELYFNVAYNSETAPSGAPEKADARGVNQLFDALALFRDAYPGLAGQFAAIPAAAFGAAPVGSPHQAAEVIEQVIGLAQAVAAAWPVDWTPPPSAALAEGSPGGPVVDSYFLNFETLDNGQTYNLYLYGRAAQPDGQPQPGSPPPPPSGWPTVTFAEARSPDPVTWTPTGPPDAVPGWWRMSLMGRAAEPDFTAASLTFGPLSVLREQSAELSTWVVRNADLIPARPTNPAFIYVSAATTFPTPAVPLIRRDRLAPIAPFEPLPQILEAILLPLAEFGAAFSPSIRIQVGYAFPLVKGGLEASAPVLLADDLKLDLSGSPAMTIAQQVADQTADWFGRRAGRTHDGRLHLAITLFGLVDRRRLPLVQFLNVPIELPAGSPEQIEAWMRGSLS